MLRFAWEGKSRLQALAFLVVGALGLACTGCEELPDVKPMMAAIASGPRFQIANLQESSHVLVGAEGFGVKLDITVPGSHYIRAYGLKTPYENTIRSVKPLLPMAIQDGYVVLAEVAFQKVPQSGDYPYEIWLIDDEGHISNRLTGSVRVQ